MPAMPRVAFTPQLRRFVDAPEMHGEATKLRDALATAFEGNPRLRGYVLDDQGNLWPNVVVFIDGQRNQDRIGPSDAVRPDLVRRWRRRGDLRRESDSCPD
jgi:sulfur-carrier protein